MILTKEQLHDALVERHGADIQAKLDKACVGIAGLGGLGSNLAIFLARLGVGHLILVDFDVVDITNLNRQHYTMKDLGIPKTLALVEQLEAINPYLTYETYTERVVPSNVERLFSECDVVRGGVRPSQIRRLCCSRICLPDCRKSRSYRAAAWQATARRT